MGFYSASSIVQDAQKHGVTVLPPDIAPEPLGLCDRDHLAWDEGGLRLGFRLVKGMGEAGAHRISSSANRSASFATPKILSVRAELRTDQLDALAEAGALSSLSSERRQAMWQARAPVARRALRPHSNLESPRSRSPSFAPSNSYASITRGSGSRSMIIRCAIFAPK